jgi:DNA-binding transcriptional LysR family regulator
MDMRRLEVFCKVVELKSFTKAAKALSLSQPTVSEHVRTLEEALGEKMVDRLGRAVEPTPAGRLFYEYATEILRKREEALQALMQFKGELSGPLLLGASTIPGAYVLPRLIGLFKNAHPGIHITLKISDSAEVARLVLEGEVEAGLIGAKWDDTRFDIEEIFSDELILAVHPDHPWAQKGSVTIDELDSQSFILRENGSGTRRIMEKILKRNNFDPARLSTVAEMGSTESVRQSIKAKIGVSILSRRAVAEDIELGLLAEVTINDAVFARSFYIIRRKKRQISPLCQTFLDFLKHGEQLRS